MSCAGCATPTPKFNDFYSENTYTWCTNCGNYGIHGALKRAMVAAQISPCQAMLCFDIGCNGNGSDKIDGYRFHGLHGRVLPFAAGAALANKSMKVVASAGDGATFGEGINHLVHAIRGNYNITFLFHNNLNYGLTTGQASPTTKRSMKMNSSPDGPTSDPLHPAHFAMACNPTFVGRGFSGDVKQLARVIQAGLEHPGFSFIEVLQSCPTYNKETPHEWYQDRVYQVEESEGYAPQDFEWARQAAADITDKIAVGVLYQNKESVPQINQQPNRTEIQTLLTEEVAAGDISQLTAVFR